MNSSRTSTITALQAAHTSVIDQIALRAPPAPEPGSAAAPTPGPGTADTLMMRRPCSLSSSSRSVSSLETIAVDDMASAPPSASAACQLMLLKQLGNKCATSQPNTMVSHDRQQYLRHAEAEHGTPHRTTAWAGKIPARWKTSGTPRRIRPAAWVVALSSAQPSACGPIRMPTTRVTQHGRQMQHAEGDHAQYGGSKQ